MSYTADDFTQALLALLPRGKAWPKDASSVQVQTLSFIGPTFARLSSRSEHLIVDAFPSTSVELLSTWEALLGLPDPCAGPATTIADRQAQVVAKLLGTGGQAVQLLIDFAARFGYTITITEQAPATGTLTHLVAGDTAGKRLVTDAGNAIFTYQVNAPLASSSHFVAGSHAGEPLAAWGDTVLECVMDEVKPAHCKVIFAYT